jgi:glutamine synthetase
MALLAPTVNAYKRLVPDSLAPTHVNWGHDNRTAFVRVPNESGSRSRVEVRAGDGSACPHLLIAALLLAGLDGIERELDPPGPVSGDAYRADDAHAGSKLPPGLGASLDALEADTWLREGLGDGLVETFFAMKRFELDRYSHWVTDWELDEYARHL